MRRPLLLVPFLIAGCAVIDRRGESVSCDVHHEGLHEETVAIVYGLVVFEPGYWEAMKSRFPNANSAYYGGCIVSPDSPSYARIRYCRRCREAERAWHEERGK